MSDFDDDDGTRGQVSVVNNRTPDSAANRPRKKQTDDEHETQIVVKK